MHLWPHFRTLMQSPKHVLVFIGIVVFVFGIISLPWTFGFARGQLAQISQDRRAAASGDVWCYTHMLDSVTGHPPGLTQEEIIATNRMPFVTDDSIADTNDRTDCYETWTETWEATDSSLQNMFRPYLPDNPADADYAAILTLTGQELDALAYATQEAQATAIASGETTEEEVEATATAEIIERSEGFNEEGMVWCFTLLRGTDDNNKYDEQRGREHRLYVSHAPGLTIDEFIPNRWMNAATAVTMRDFQRACHPTYQEALDFILSYEWAFIDRDFDAAGDPETELKDDWPRAWYMVESELIERVDASFADFGSPLSITFEEDDDTLAAIAAAATAVVDEENIAGCETLLAAGQDDNWVLLPHEYGLDIDDVLEIANSNPDTSGDYDRYYMACFWTYSEIARFRGEAFNDDELTALSDATILEPQPAEDTIREIYEAEPYTIVTSENREAILEIIEKRAPSIWIFDD